MIARTQLQTFSPDEKYQVIVKSLQKDAKTSKKPEQFIVVYDRKKALKTVSVRSLCESLTIIETPTYASVALNNDLLLLTVVEVEQKKQNSKNDTPTSSDYDLNSHEYRQSWGERLSTIYHSCVACINLKAERLTLIEKPGLSLIDPFFYKTNSSASQFSSVGCIAFQELPYKLGLIYCKNRVSFLLSCQVSADEDQHEDQIEPEVVYGDTGKLALSSPSVYFDQTSGNYDSVAFFLERDAGGAHNKPARLMQFCFKTRKVQTILDNKQSRELINNKTAYSDYGPLFAEKLPAKCHTLDGRYLLLHSDTPVSSKPFAIDLRENKLKLLSFPEENCEILEVKNDWIIAVGSSLNRTPNLYLCNITSNDLFSDLSNLTWLPIENPESKKLPHISYETFAFPARDYTDKLVSCIFISPTDLKEAASQCIFIAHGGPHSQLTTGFNQSVALYAALGLKVCLGKLSYHKNCNFFSV